MKRFSDLTDPEIVTLLRGGAVGVLQTDTLYGIVARAEDERAVERVYAIKARASHKSPIVLISDTSQLSRCQQNKKSKYLMRSGLEKLV